MQSIIVSAKNINSCNHFLEKYISEFANENFQLANSLSNPDFKNVDIPDAKKNIPMDDIRELIKWSSLKPSYKNHKIIVVNADGLSIESQNALLKTVEEPPEYLQIILKSSNYKQLLDTIISRCKVFEVENSPEDNKQNEDEIQKAFEEICSLKEMNLGQRIDWANEHKTELAGADKTIEKFNMWIKGLRLGVLGQGKWIQGNGLAPSIDELAISSQTTAILNHSPVILNCLLRLRRTFQDLPSTQNSLPSSSNLSSSDSRMENVMSSSDSPKVRSEDPGPSPIPISYAIQKITTLSDLIFKIKTYNLNPFLALEYFLVSL